MELLTCFIRNAVLLVCYLLNAALAQGQGFLFPDTTARWVVNSVTMGATEPWRIYGMAGDTLIDTTAYQKVVWDEDTVFDGLGQVYAGALREEQGLWLFLPPGDSTELRLYDFSGDEGDTIVIDPLDEGWGPIAYSVVEIDTLMLPGGGRRRWQLSAPDLMLNEVWIEGIGSTNGPLTHSSTIQDAGTWLICFHESDTLIYIEPNADDCTWTIVGVHEINEEERFYIYPNPAQEQVNIASAEPMTNAEVIMTNAQGVAVLHAMLKGERTIDVSTLARGSYQLEIKTQDWIHYRKQLFLQ